MLMQVYSYAISNKDTILERMMGSSSMIERARSLWTAYAPETKEGLVIAGVDSSWNYFPYSGYYVYAVDAVCMTRESRDLIPPKIDVGVGIFPLKDERGIAHNPRLALQSKGMEFEYQLAKEGSKSSDFILIDGSVLARFYDRRGEQIVPFYDYARDLMKESNVIFVSKRSDSTQLLGAPVGDIHYFNKASSDAGYSQLYYDPIGVSVFYVRLSDHSPCLRVEVPGEMKEGGQKEVVDVLGSSSVDGYPYELRIAHESCVVSNKDMERLVDMLGLTGEIGGREVVGE